MPTPLELASLLVAIPSVNPMGGQGEGPEFFEERLTDALIGLLRDWGIPHEVHSVAPRRANVLARFEADPGRPTLLWEVHQDTVPTEGMTIAPFRPEVRDGRLFGRGACDVKGGMAAMLSAFERLARERPARAANVVLACTCDEEATQLGVRDLVRLWGDDRGRSRLLADPPAAALIAEPTNLDVVVAHKGATRWAIRTTGRACHSSDPSRGINAIYRMAKVLAALEACAAKLPSSRPAHPLCGPATLSVGRIRGGQSVNIVPDECEIEVDRRSIPGEDPAQVRDELMAAVRDSVDFEVEAGAPWIAASPLGDEQNGPLAERLLAAIQPIAGVRRKLGVAYGTDASTIAAAGVPSVVFGPGSIAQAHTVDEWLPIAELDAAAEILFHLAADR
ncbi:MAG: M20 family metallopeptidase [Planctomyces sp.]|nr:M20 family metallopeptidase [Planctomyces sp.]